uniref:LRRNT domain-containing protein n=1 Tax=Heterorhabditis bacteriophora TaxID=37862 RepID=A0A1I7XMA9_HETBA
MWWLIIFIIIPLSGADSLCPPRCECVDDTSISCISLNSTELLSVMTTLGLPQWNQIRELSVRNTPSISLDLLPTMDSLE